LVEGASFNNFRQNWQKCLRTAAHAR
jgi:hypothetical protein